MEILYSPGEPRGGDRSTQRTPLENIQPVRDFRNSQGSRHYWKGKALLLKVSIEGLFVIMKWSVRVGQYGKSLSDLECLVRCHYGWKKARSS